MDWFVFLRILSGMLMIAGYLPTMWETVHKKCAPLNKATCIVWMIFDGITFFAMCFAGTATLQIGACACMNVILVGLAFRYGATKWNRIEIVCLAVAACGLVLWLTTGNPNFGMTCSLAAMTIGTFPMIKDAWNTPQEFNRIGWTCWVVSNALAILAVPSWEYAHYAQPIGFEITAVIIYVLLWTRPRPDPRKQTPLH